jgi:hypothetical protein
MPQISSFYGITIWMYYDEGHHRGRPHFHVRYGEAEASVDIERAVVIAGALPVRAMRLVVEWVSLHRRELGENWERARSHRPLFRVTPLP